MGGWVSLNIKFWDNFRADLFNKPTYMVQKLDLYNHYSLSLLIKTCIFINSLFISLWPFMIIYQLKRAEAKSGFLDMGMPVTQPPIDQMSWGIAFRGLLWVSIEFYRGHMSLTWPKLNSNPQKPPTCKISSHLDHWGLSYRYPLVWKPRLCSLSFNFLPTFGNFHENLLISVCTWRAFFEIV